MPSEVVTEPAVVTLATKAPMKMLGHIRRPSRSNAARAIPVGGHTAVALACTRASFNPSLAAATYRAASRRRTGRSASRHREVTMLREYNRPILGSQGRRPPALPPPPSGEVRPL